MPRIDAAREAALHLLNTWDLDERPFEDLLNEMDAALSDGRDIRFARHLALGVLRWRKRLDWMLGHFSKRPLDELDPGLLNILRLGAYQTTFLDRVPDRAAVHTSVELAKRHGARRASGLINAVLRNLQRQPQRVEYPNSAREPVRNLSLYHSHPEWLIERWCQRWGYEETIKLLKANNQQADLWLRVNTLRTDAEHLCAELDLEPGPLPGYYRATIAATTLRSQAYEEGHFQIQDPNASLAVALLAPRPGEKVLDLCSAPGGKATQIAQLMHDTGTVIAADISPQRLQRVRANAQRLHLSCLHFVAQDARANAGRELFDRVLADVPCSATGIFGRHPDARWRKKPEQLPELAKRQREILNRAFAHLRPGGVLVYSTCSLEREENEDIIELFLEGENSAQLEEASKFLPEQTWADRYVQTVPGRHIGDGAFAARIRKNNA